MSNTRRSVEGAPFRQERFASAPEFERGLLGNLVAKRCTQVASPETRELIWFIQYLSHQEGVKAIAKRLIEKFTGELQTKEMAELKLRPGKNCNAEQVKQIRAGFPVEGRHFPLKGETTGECAMDVLSGNKADADRKAANYPTSYPAQTFFDFCREAADSNLELVINSICLDPASNLESGPWYFPALFRSLRQYLNDYSNHKIPAFTTSLGHKVSEALDYTAFNRCLTLIPGEARTGKTFAARAWCHINSGRARFVEVATGNDDVGFFRAIARGLGLGNLSRYKACDIRDRVESVLLSGDLVLVFDEAQRLWPQRYIRQSFPGRIVWVMAMANAGVPIAMIATPQFIETQKVMEKQGWNSRQLIGRLGHYESLPSELPQEDLAGVAESVLPEASGDTLKALAIYARNSARYLAAIDSIAGRARYLAMKGGRSSATTADVRRAMKESVIPADSKLQAALAIGQNLKHARLSLMPLPEVKPEPGQNEFPAPPERSITPAAPTPLVGV